MPIADVRSVLVTRDPDERNVLISAHMDRLEAQLAETRAAVNSLRVLLDTARTRAPISRRQCRRSPRSASPTRSTLAMWRPGGKARWPNYVPARATRTSVPRVRPAASSMRRSTSRSARGPWCTSPCPKSPATVAVSVECTIPAAELVITTHYGSAADIDLAYADLGSYLAEHHIAGRRSRFASTTCAIGLTPPTRPVGRPRSPGRSGLGELDRLADPVEGLTMLLTRPIETSSTSPERLDVGSVWYVSSQCGDV